MELVDSHKPKISLKITTNTALSPNYVNETIWPLILSNWIQFIMPWAGTVIQDNN